MCCTKIKKKVIHSSETLTAANGNNIFNQTDFLGYDTVEVGRWLARFWRNMLHPSSQEYMVSQPRRQNSIFTLLKTLNLRISSYITPTSYLEHPGFKHIPKNAHCQRVSLASIVFSLSDVAVVYKKNHYHVVPYYFSIHHSYGFHLFSSLKHHSHSQTAK